MNWTGTSGNVLVEDADGIAILRLDRPEKLNALTIPMLRDVGDALDTLGTADDVRAIVLTGAGRAFSAGDDLPATEELQKEDFEELLNAFQTLTRAVLTTEVPVAAALNGIAVGGAAELTLACDVRLGHPRSDYLFPENEVGLTISNASSYLLPRLIGSRALPLVLGARRITGTEAHHLGLIDYLVDSAGDVLPACLEMMRHWVDRGLATPFHLRLLRPSLDEVEAAMRRENEIAAEAWDSGAAVNGIRRFLREQKERRSQP